MDPAFYQERLTSASQLERGLLANLVAKRCEALSNTRDRELIWGLQFISHQGGVGKLSRELVNRFRDEIGTPAMRRFGMADGQLYTPTQAKLIAGEIASAGGQAPLVEKMKRIEYVKRLECQAAIASRLSEMIDGESAFSQSEVGGPPPQPGAYPLSEILDLKQLEKELLPKLLARLCVDPSRDLATFRPWWFASAVECLHEYVGEWIEARRASLVPTELSRRVYESLDFALASGGMMILDGPLLRIGKSFAARTWCELRPGLARYVEMPAVTEDAGFYRAIAAAIGATSALSLKGIQLRGRVELALQSSRIMLVIDNAHYLWPQSNRRQALPIRLNWLLSALVSKGVPVALVTTPQFAHDKQIVEANTGWSGAQFFGQIGECVSLPKSLSKAELIAVAEHCLPEADNKSVLALALYALSSGRYLAAIESVVKRARSIACKAGRDKVGFSDVEEALTHFIIPSDRALTKTFQRAESERPAAPERGSAAAPAGQAVRSAGMPEVPAHNFTRAERPVDRWGITPALNRQELEAIH
jgi:hypothetical protein